MSPRKTSRKQFQKPANTITPHRLINNKDFFVPFDPQTDFQDTPRKVKKSRNLISENGKNNFFVNPNEEVIKDKSLNTTYF